MSIAQSIVTGFGGELVWLKAQQDDSCRLYGCSQKWDTIVFLRAHGVDRVGFCQEHAYRFHQREFFVGGVSPG